MKTLISFFALFYSCLTLAQPSYQVDLLIFAHKKNSSTIESGTNFPMIPESKKWISLKQDTPYQLLKPSLSGLKNEYYLLTHNSNYQVLGNYSWTQPKNNQNTIILPKIDHNGWSVQGHVLVHLGNYYEFDSNLQCTLLTNPQSSIAVSQKQRLAANSVYYLDHPNIGMLVKVH